MSRDVSRDSRHGMSKTAHSVTLLRTLVTVLFVCAIAALVLTALLGFEAPNDTLLHLSWGLLLAAIVAVFAHLGFTTTLTPPQKRVWLRQLTGLTAVSAWGAYLTCEDLRAAAIRFAEETRVTRRSILGAALAGTIVAPTRPLLGRQPSSFRGRNVGQEREVEALKLCWCPPGRFVMGSPSKEIGHRPDEAQVDVILAKGFWMAKCEATQGQWRRLVGQFPDRKPAAQTGEGDDVPVYWVNFDEAEGFCTALTNRGHASGTLPAHWEFRLPTEAQWEYACRAGTVTATAFGDRLGRSQANFAGEPLNGGQNGPAVRRASEVGRYPANPWGICDMHGNVFEWCRDWYHARLPGGTDPDLRGVQGTANRDGTYSRVRRGGAWNDDGWACRSALRLRYEPERRSDHIGFRVVAVES